MITVKALYTGCGLSQESLESYKEKGVEIIAAGCIREEEICSHIHDVDIYIPGGKEIVTEKIVEAANRLKLVIFCGVDYEYYLPMEALKSRGIAVSNAPGINSQAVAEYTVSLMMIQAKRLLKAHEITSGYGWEGLRSKEIRDSTVGIIGMGNIGIIVAEILSKGFGCRVLYYSRTRKQDLEQRLGIVYSDLEELCLESDMVSIHLPYNTDTTHMIGSHELKLMKKQCDIINTSHAEIIDPEALKLALTEGWINTVSMDNFYFSHHTAEGNLREADKWGFLQMKDRFFLTSHCAYNTPSTVNRIEQEVLRKIDRYLLDEKPL